MFIDVFNQLCNEIGKSANFVMAECGFSNSTYTGWKSKKNVPSGTYLAKIADYFSVSVDYLLERTDVREMAGDMSRLGLLNAQLDEVGQAKLLSYADDLVSSGKYEKENTASVG